MVEVLANTVECNLEIASAEEIEHCINELEKLAGHDYGDKLQEYKLRKVQDDDVQSFLIKKPESSSYYETENNQLNLKNRGSKMNHICESLSKAYRLIGYFPLEQRCRRAISYSR
ncbi:unnamed protein product, partial [Rotaria magnacalcarata]